MIEVIKYPKAEKITLVGSYNNGGYVQLKYSGNYTDSNFQLQQNVFVVTGAVIGIYSVRALSKDAVYSHITINLAYVGDTADGFVLTDISINCSSKWGSSLSKYEFQFLRKDIEINSIYSSVGGNAEIQIGGNYEYYDLEVGNYIYVKGFVSSTGVEYYSGSYEILSLYYNNPDNLSSIEIDTPYIYSCDRGWINSNDMKTNYYLQVSIESKGETINYKIVSDSTGLMKLDVSGFVRSQLIKANGYNYDDISYRDLNLYGDFAVTLLEKWGTGGSATAEINLQFESIANGSTITIDINQVTVIFTAITGASYEKCFQIDADIETTAANFKTVFDNYLSNYSITGYTSARTGSLVTLTGPYSFNGVVVNETTLESLEFNVSGTGGVWYFDGDGTQAAGQPAYAASIQSALQIEHDNTVICAMFPNPGMADRMMLFVDPLHVGAYAAAAASSCFEVNADGVSPNYGYPNTGNFDNDFTYTAGNPRANSPCLQYDLADQYAWPAWTTNTQVANSITDPNERHWFLGYGMPKYIGSVLGTAYCIAQGVTSDYNRVVQRDADFLADADVAAAGMTQEILDQMDDIRKMSTGFSGRFQSVKLDRYPDGVADPTNHYSQIFTDERQLIWCMANAGDYIRLLVQGMIDRGVVNENATAWGVLLFLYCENVSNIKILSDIGITNSELSDTYYYTWGNPYLGEFANLWKYVINDNAEPLAKFLIIGAPEFYNEYPFSISILNKLGVLQRNESRLDINSGVLSVSADDINPTANALNRVKLTGSYGANVKQVSLNFSLETHQVEHFHTLIPLSGEIDDLYNTQDGELVNAGCLQVTTDSQIRLPDIIDIDSLSWQGDAVISGAANIISITTGGILYDLNVTDSNGYTYHFSLSEDYANQQKYSFLIHGIGNINGAMQHVWAFADDVTFGVQSQYFYMPRYGADLNTNSSDSSQTIWVPKDYNRDRLYTLGVGDEFYNVDFMPVE